MKKKVTVLYRDEFETEIIAKGKTILELRDNAIKKFKSNKYKIKSKDNLWSEYFMVFDENGASINYPKE